MQNLSVPRNFLLYLFCSALANSLIFVKLKCFMRLTVLEGIKVGNTNYQKSSVLATVSVLKQTECRSSVVDPYKTYNSHKTLKIRLLLLSYTSTFLR